MNQGWDLSSSDEEDESLLKNIKGPILSPETILKNQPNVNLPKKKVINSSENKEKPLCPYGEKCYRKNPKHFEHFSHKQKRKLVGQSPINQKKLKTGKSCNTKSDTNPYAAYQSSIPHHLMLTTVQDIGREFNYKCCSKDSVLLAPPSISIKDILSENFGRITKSAQFNYCIDVEWLMQQYPPKSQNCPLTIVHGEQGASNMSLKKEAEAFPNIELCQAELPPYGTHHTKMMLLLYDSGMRILIGTANLVEQDWKNRTQGLWMSDVFPFAQTPKQSEFQASLIEYLTAYRRKQLQSWIDVVTKCDMSSANVLLVASVPGRHSGSTLNSWGHMKLRKMLQKNVKPIDSSWPVIGQFSSIGSLGPSKDKWLCGEWITSLSSCQRKSGVLQSKPELKLIFPSVENVRLSLDGYPSGASLPYSKENHLKQPWLKSLLYQWKSSHCGRDEASPHIKTYTRISPYKTNIRVPWFLLTSANLSKAAWGCLEKQGSQLAIKSYELGVLFLPSLNQQSGSNSNYFYLSEPPNNADNRLPIPFSLPLQSYCESDQPWTWNAPHKELPDRFGNIWVPS